MNVEMLHTPVFTKPSGNDIAHITHATSIWSKITKVAVCSSLVVLANHRSIAAATAHSHLNHHNIFSAADSAHTTSPSNQPSKLEADHSHQKGHVANQCKNKRAETCSLDDFNSANKGLSSIGELAFGTIRGAHVYAQSELNCRYELDKPATIGQMFALPFAEVMRDSSVQQAIKNMTNELLSSALPQALDTFLNVTNESEFKQKVQDLSAVITQGVLKGALGNFSNVTDLLENPQFQDSMKFLVNTILDEGLKKMPHAMGYLTAMAIAVIYIATVSLVASVHLYQKVMGGKNSIMTHVANDITQGAIGGAANANTAVHLNNLAQNASAGVIAGIVDELKKPENTQVLLNIFGQLVATGAGTPLNTGNQSQAVNENDNISGNEYEYDNISSIV